MGLAFVLRAGLSGVGALGKVGMGDGSELVFLVCDKVRCVQ